jgi:sucrose-6F-phosphate phosphohydrolase
MIIVCDLDRTLIPNGKEEYDNSLGEFYEIFNKNKDITLVYATGRNLELFKKAEKEYPIKKPDFFVGAVGTEVYINENNELVEDPDWDSYVKERHPNWNREEIIDYVNENFSEISDDFYLQDKSVQNKNKISYYLKDEDKSEEIISKIENYINEKNILAEAVYSFDPHKDLGLLDILPKYATKLGAVQFLIKRLGEEKDDVIYCGDSGNDLLPLTSGIKSVLVKNAREDVKEKALKIIAEKNVDRERLYIAKGNGRLNGNYSSGVIEGLDYFGIS